MLVILYFMGLVAVLFLAREHLLLIALIYGVSLILLGIDLLYTKLDKIDKLINIVQKINEMHRAYQALIIYGLQHTTKKTKTDKQKT